MVLTFAMNAQCIGRRVIAPAVAVMVIAVGALTAGCWHWWQPCAIQYDDDHHHSHDNNAPQQCSRIPDRKELQSHRGQPLAPDGASAASPNRTSRGSSQALVAPPQPFAKHPVAQLDRTPRNVNTPRIGRRLIVAAMGLLCSSQAARPERRVWQEWQPSAINHDNDYHEHHDNIAVQQCSRVPDRKDPQPDRGQPVHPAGSCSPGADSCSWSTSRAQRRSLIVRGAPHSEVVAKTHRD